MRNEIFYIGGFPPPYGGVTVKNQMLVSELKKQMCIRHCTSSSSIAETVFTLRSFLFAKKFILGIGSTRKLMLLAKIMSQFFPKRTAHSIIFVMGGSMADTLADNPQYIP